MLSNLNILLINKGTRCLIKPIFIFLFSSLSVSQLDSTGPFKSILNINNEVMDHISKRLDCDYVLGQSFVRIKNKQFEVGLLMLSRDKTQYEIIFLNKYGNILSTSEIITRSQFKELGGAIQFRYYCGHVYLSGDSSKAFIIDGNSIKKTDNPWYREYIDKQYRNNNLRFAFGLSGWVPLFRIIDKNIYALDNNRIIIYDPKMKELNDYDISFIAKDLSLDIDPIMGLFNRKIYFWSRRELYTFNITNSKFITYNVDESIGKYDNVIFVKNKYGLIRQEGDDFGVTYYSDNRFLFLIAQTNNGLHVLQLIDSH